MPFLKKQIFLLVLQSSFPDDNVHFCTKTAFEFITIIEWDHKFNRFLLPKLKKNE